MRKKCQHEKKVTLVRCSLALILFSVMVWAYLGAVFAQQPLFAIDLVQRDPNNTQNFSDGDSPFYKTLNTVNADSIRDDKSLSVPDQPSLSAQERRTIARLYQKIMCVVCDGQSIGGSDARVAQAMRLVVDQQVRRGASEEDVLKFFIERYGPRVITMPPFSFNTLILWLFAPVFLVGAVVWVFVGSRSKMRL